MKPNFLFTNKKNLRRTFLNASSVHSKVRMMISVCRHLKPSTILISDSNYNV